MNRRARTWAAAAALLLLLAGGTLAFGQVTGTFAIFNAVVENPGNILTGGWVPKPSGTSSSPSTSGSYSTATLNWTAGANPPVTSQTLQYANGGSGGSASCPSAGSGSYGSFSTPAAGANTASVTGSNLSNWWCFEINSVDGNWTTDYVTFAGVRILVVQSIALNNGTGGTAGKMENGDQIVITYNQPVNVGSTVDVEACASTNTIVVGGACGTAGSFGSIGGGSLSVNKAKSFGTSVVTGSGSSTITITLAGSSSTTAVSGAGTFTPAGTGAVATANTSEGPCSSTSSPTCTVGSSGDF